MSSLLQPASNMPAPSSAEVMSARTSERSINLGLPTQQAIFAPQPSVHALKPLTKILSFGPSARKPLKAERWAAAPAWSTDVKSRGRGLIGAERADFSKKGQRVNDSAVALVGVDTYRIHKIMTASVTTTLELRTVCSERVAKRRC